MTPTQKLAMFLTFALAVTLLISPLALANEKDKQTIARRMQDRFAQLVELRQAGKVGETFQGLTEAVKPEYAREKEVAAIVSAENSDRQALYAIIAKEQSTTAEAVARAAGDRNFKIARSGDWLKPADGKWFQKK